MKTKVKIGGVLYEKELRDTTHLEVQLKNPAKTVCSKKDKQKKRNVIKNNVLKELKNI